MRLRLHPLYTSLFLLSGGSAQDIENFRVEVTASAWIRNTSGAIQSGIVPVDLKSDLGMEQNRPQLSGRLVVKPGRRHRLFVEGTPYRMTGDQVIARQLIFAGRTYSIQDRVISDASIDTVFGGYQFDFLSAPGGHWGVQAGAGYVNATGTLSDPQRGFTGSESQSFPLPLVGTEFRTNHRLLTVGGEVKGMALGNRGHYVQAEGSAGVNLGQHVTLQAGYRVVDADIHRQDGTGGFSPRFTGPMFCVQLRY